MGHRGEIFTKMSKIEFSVEKRLKSSLLLAKTKFLRKGPQNQ